MSRADAFTQSDITKRALETEVDPAFIERLAISARIPDLRENNSLTRSNTRCAPTMHVFLLPSKNGRHASLPL